jgi:hypothetical protein
MENEMSKPSGKSKKDTPKPIQEKGQVRDAGDAYKFVCFAVRAAIAAGTGKVFGNTSVDTAIGEAISSLYPPSDVADMGFQYAIAIHAAAGAWKAVEGDGSWDQ